MPYQVKHMIEGKGMPLYVQKDDVVTKALAIMIEHDYSQLPVVLEEQGMEIPEGMITYEGIIRGIRNFQLGIESLRVRDVMTSVPTYSVEDDLFDILDELKETNAVLITGYFGPELVGIVTSYDATEYFRNRTEDLMRVEDIEITIKDLIREAYTSWNDKFQDMLDEDKLDKSVKLISNRGQGSKPKTFNELTMAEYINLLTISDTWEFFQPIFNLPVESVKGLLHSIRETRNLLAHFRGDLSAEQRDRLKFGAEWLARCQEEYQERKERERNARISELYEIRQVTDAAKLEQKESADQFIDVMSAIREFSVTESAQSGGRYSALADFLQSQPGRVDQIPLTFNQIEEIIDGDLPASARVHRAWWANDSVGHSHSQLWLDAGWRTTYINLSEQRITFSRIREREKAYIGFFSKLLDEIRRNSPIPTKDQSPDGSSWIVLQTIPRGKSGLGSFICSFTRDKRFRIELYLDLRDKDLTKRVFDTLYEQKENFESQLGPIEWERLDNKRASRIAIYRDGHITEEQKHAELRSWAVSTFNKFYAAFLEPAEKTILEAWTG